MSQSNEPISDIQKYQQEFYEKNKKNTFFKKAQKKECAEMICSKMSLTDLMDQTFWIIPNKNQLYFDYRVFKLFGNPNNYMEIVNNVLEFCTWCISEYDNFEIHINMSTFTVSAAERYRDLIILFCDECTKRNTSFSELLIHMNFHNTPNTIDQIASLVIPILPPEVRPKLRLLKKEESHNILTQLYEESNKIYSP